MSSSVQQFCSDANSWVLAPETQAAMEQEKLDYVPAISLFSTKWFKKHWWIKWLCREIGYVFVTNEDQIPGTFTTYLRVISKRTYEGNALKADLYYLHELWHMLGFLERKPMKTWLDWQRAMGVSELEASLASECVVHFLIPEARDGFQGQEIWVDRFLQKKKFRKYLQTEDPKQVEKLFRKLRKHRLKVLHHPQHNDYLEWQIRNYGQQNMRWYMIWATKVGFGTDERAAWRIVEEFFADPEWRNKLPKWLREYTSPNDSKLHPFPEQAVKFQKVYEESAKTYGNWPLWT